MNADEQIFYRVTAEFDSFRYFAMMVCDSAYFGADSKQATAEFTREQFEEFTKVVWNNYHLSVFAELKVF